ncbi:MAG: hypothetical protein ABH820_01635 [Patescibacteria group bacterium]|nr:hypothetical protein [Patescibacteria group bacterium]MBU2509069.1 hypothetical protein [Patescibacteria group bacterium]
MTIARQLCDEYGFSGICIDSADDLLNLTDEQAAAAMEMLPDLDMPRPTRDHALRMLALTSGSATRNS